MRSPIQQAGLNLRPPSVLVHRGQLRQGLRRQPLVHALPQLAAAAEDIDGKVEVFPEYADGLKDIEGFSHIILIFHFHLSGQSPLIIKPYLEDKEHGIFATRGPGRPNSIGISVVRLIEVKGNTLHVKGMDIIDGTPLLDIKPYVPEFDTREVTGIGWLTERVHRVAEVTDDGRFTN